MRLNVLPKYIVVLGFLMVAGGMLSRIVYGITSNHGITSTVLIVVSSLLLLYYISRLNISDRTKLILITTLFVRLGLVYFDIYARGIFTLPNSGLDSEAFNNAALSLPLESLSGYSAVVSVLYGIFGYERLFVQFLNVVFMIFAMIISLNIMQKLNVPVKLQWVAIAIFAFLPSNIIISAILLRESLLVLLSAISLYFFVNYTLGRGGRTINLIASILFIFAAAYLHSSMIILLVPYVFYAVFYRQGIGYRLDLLSVVRFTIYVSIVVGIYLVLGQGSLGYFSGVDTIDGISSQMTARADGGSSYLEFTSNVSSVWEVILYAPLKFIYFFGSPMPWDWRSVVDALTFILSSAIYSYILIKMLLFRNKSGFLKIIVASIVLLGLVHAVSVFNAGTAMRHREKLITFMIVGYAIYRKEEKKHLL